MDLVQLALATTNYANSFHNSPKSAIFSTLQLHGKYSTPFLFDPPMQNTLYTNNIATLYKLICVRPTMLYECYLS